MSLQKLQFFKKNFKGSSSIEFLAVFAFLFVFFILILDVALFFRQIYLVQTIADEVMARLNTEKQCSKDLADTMITANKAVSFYFEKQNFAASSKNKKTVKITTSDDKYTFLISCRNEITPDSLVFIYKYKGIVMYRGGKSISSNVSVNTTYY